MIDFNGIKESTSEEIQEKNNKLKLNITDLLEKIDVADFDYYSTLNDDERKLFLPYTLLRWASSLDDSQQLTYKAKTLEDIFGKWTSGGKESLNELVQDFNTNSTGACISVSKYAESKYDWRIKFAMKDSTSCTEFTNYMLEFTKELPKLVSLISTEDLQNTILMLNYLVNKNFWEIQKYPEAVYKLLCLVSVASTDELKPKKYNWIPFSKNNKKSDSEIFDIFKKLLPKSTALQLNIQEYKIIIKNTSTTEFEEMIKSYGYQKQQQKSLVTKFKAEKAKYEK